MGLKDRWDDLKWKLWGERRALKALRDPAVESRPVPEPEPTDPLRAEVDAIQSFGEGRGSAIGLILSCIDPTEYHAVHLEPAIDELRQEGPAGSDRLAPLIHAFTESRSEGVVYALHVATHLQMTPALETALTEVAAANPLKSGPRGWFTPEIEGVGQVGWTDGTHSRAVTMAKKALHGGTERG